MSMVQSLSKFKRGTYLFLVLTFFCLQVTFATDYYCDPIDGNSMNDGTKNSPWGTLQSVFESKMQFEPGDKIYLEDGNHGDVIVVGENSKYIKIEALGENAAINSIVFGTDRIKASRWTFSNIKFRGLANSSTVFINENSTKIRLLSNQFFGKDTKSIAVEIYGNQCKIENNVINNYENALTIFGTKNQIRNNRIEYFSGNAIEISGNSNLFEYNLIKESIATNVTINNGFYFNSTNVKGTIIRGNTIINFTSAQRKSLGLLNGIYSDTSAISETIIENNVIISNGANGISLNGEINNTKIVNNTVVNPYFGMKFKGADETNIPLAIKIQGKGNSLNVVIRNNLVNNIVLDNIKGLADHNYILPINVHDFDLCFNNWAKFDFSLNTDSKALNNGTAELAPKLDASLNSRSIGNFVNIGAFEFSKINEQNETFTIISEISDRQIHSKGKGDWDGQPQIRVGGTGEGVDGAGIFPFKLPLIPGGKEIFSVNFKVHLKKIDNKPEGSIDLYGLAPKSNYWITEDMYYQGVYGQDINARPIQNNYVSGDSYLGDVRMQPQGKSALKNYIETVFENGSNPGDYIFLRLNPNSRDVTDYNRWSFVSANSDTKKKDLRPRLELKIGYKSLKNTASTKEIKNTIAVRADALNPGNFSLYFLGFENETNIAVAILNYKGKEVFSESITLNNNGNKEYHSKNISLTTGKYFLQYTYKEKVKKQAIFIW